MQREAASFLFWGVPFVLSCSFVSHTKQDDPELCHDRVSPARQGKGLVNPGGLHRPLQRPGGIRAGGLDSGGERGPCRHRQGGLLGGG